MASNKNDKRTDLQDNQVTIEVKQKPGAAVYSKAVLIESAEELGTTPELMAGALMSVESDALTRQEADDALKEYLVCPVNLKKGSEK